MKVTSKKIEVEFEPVEIILTIETAEELRVLRAMLNMSNDAILKAHEDFHETLISYTLINKMSEGLYLHVKEIMKDKGVM